MRTSKIMWRKNLLLAAGIGLYLRQKEDEEQHERFKSIFRVRNSPKVEELSKKLNLFKHKWGIPGLCFMVSANGETVYRTSIGHSDIENQVECHNSTVMRIASISKPLAAMAILKLWEHGKLDLHKPITHYAKTFPEKTFDGSHVDVTVHQLLSHTAGIRHYTKPEDSTTSDDSTAPTPSPPIKMIDYKEMIINYHYNSVTEALKLFQDDSLVSKPGTSFLYSTHGWTLLSAVLEGVTGLTFLDYMKQNIFEPLNMYSTVPEYNDTLISNRARYYRRDDNGQLLNTPYVDLSYKWAGGGYLSTTEDLVSFGNALLLSYNEYQRTRDSGFNNTNDRHNETKEQHQRRYILEPSTVAMMWTPVANDTGSDFSYGLGWMTENNNNSGTNVKEEGNTPFLVYHSGGAIGASSVLVIIPGPVSEHDNPDEAKGVVLALLVNLQEIEEVAKLGRSLALEVYRSTYSRNGN